MSRVYAWVWSPVGAIVGFLALALALPTFLHGPADWEKAFVPAGLNFRQGGAIYQLGDPFVYPPFVFLLTVPSSYLPPTVDRAWWWVWNTVAAAVVVCGSWRLAGGVFQARPPRRELLAFALGFAASLGFVFHVAVCRQIDLFIGAFLIGGLWFVHRSRPILGGALIGVAAAVKCTPLLFVPYFVWTGQWRAAASVLVLSVLVNLLPDALYPTNGPPRLVEWARKYLPATGRQDIDPGMWYTDISFNHSIAGLTTRLATRDHVRVDGKWTQTLKTERPPASTLRTIVYACGLVLTLAGAAVSWVRPRTSEGQVFEFGMILCLMLLMSPVSSTQHFCILFLPAWAVARFAGTRRDTVMLAIAVLVAVLGLLTNRDLAGKYVNSVVMWYGAIPVLTTLLFAGCWWGRLRAALETKVVPAGAPVA